MIIIIISVNVKYSYVTSKKLLSLFSDECLNEKILLMAMINSTWLLLLVVVTGCVRCIAFNLFFDVLFTLLRILLLCCFPQIQSLDRQMLLRELLQVSVSDHKGKMPFCFHREN